MRSQTSSISTTWQLMVTSKDRTRNLGLTMPPSNSDACSNLLQSILSCFTSGFRCLSFGSLTSSNLQTCELPLASRPQPCPNFWQPWGYSALFACFLYWVCAPHKSSCCLSSSCTKLLDETTCPNETWPRMNTSGSLWELVCQVGWSRAKVVS